MNEQSRERLARVRQAAEAYLQGAINERHLAGALAAAAGEIDAAVAAAEPAGEDAATEWYQAGRSAEAAPEARSLATALAELQ